MSEYVLPKRGVAYVTYMGLVSQADTKLLIASPTLAAGDFKISKDGGTIANLATLPTNTPAASSQIKISLSATEMEADNVTVVGIDAAGAQWCSFCLNIQTATRAAEDLAFPATSGRSMVVDASGLVDANMVKAGPTGSGTAQTAGDIGIKTGFSLTATTGLGNQTSNITGNLSGSVGSVTGAVGSVTGAVGSVTGNVGGNVVGSVGSISGITFPTNFSTILISASGHISRVTLTDTLTTYTGNTVQTGDAFARIGAPAGASVSADIAAIQADNPNRFTRAVAFTNFAFPMVNTSDVLTTGLTVAGQISKDGGAFATITPGAVTEVGGGLYKINLSATEMTADIIVLRFSATGAKDRLFSIVTQPT